MLYALAGVLLRYAHVKMQAQVAGILCKNIQNNQSNLVKTC